MYEHRKLRLSNSGSETLEECNFKYYLKYVIRLKPDSDYQFNQPALVYGSLLHLILEFKIKNPHLRFDQLFEDAYFTIAIERDIPNLSEIVDQQIKAKMYLHYKDFERFCYMNRDSLSFICSELDIQSDDSNLIVDTVIVFKGKWYIIDFKSFSENLYKEEKDKDKTLKTLTLMPQLIKYAAHKKQIAKMLNLDIDDFGGIGLMQFYKLKNVLKEGQSLSDYVKEVRKRLKKQGENRLTFRLIVLNKEHIEHNLKNYLYLHAQRMQLVKELHSIGDNLKIANEKIRKNTHSCINKYGSSCPFFSFCHKRKFTDKTQAQVFSNDEKVAIEFEELTF